MKKSIAFIYGLLAYLIFLIAFLYAIGFVGNFIVPKSIDSGTETNFWQALLVNALLLSLFVIQHSIMARPAFKKWFTKFISPAIERSTFVLLTSLILLLIFWQWQPITSVVWKAENITVAMILTGIFIFGWLIVFLSTFMINHFELFGLEQIFDNLKNKQSQSHVLQVNFFYKIVRHPIMLGFIIAFWATPLMTLGHLIFAIGTTVYIVLSVKYLEEKDLRSYIGKDYEDYQKKVPMLIPFMKSGK
ncbi:MAG: isoprenylcysteine carboxylmethyltransferase family protein [Calditrichaeota bacterium]|nr:MAG: isoprenylcysteine carboxylmethyltransferase family protein [Calditrichota bacterium]